MFVPSSIKALAFTRKTRAQLAPTDAALVAPLLAALDALNTQIKALDVELEALARETYPATERLRQIRLTAVLFSHGPRPLATAFSLEEDRTCARLRAAHL